MSVASDETGQEVFVRPPAHPVPTLQGPFEESMVESVHEGSDFDVPIDAVSRRTMLLEGPTYERIIAGRWKQRPGEKYHPLWKLMAQMTFGLHLLARNLAKSEDEVMKILQAHVDDIDDFLERTSEDFELAYSDMYERLRCLKLPLQHGEVFDRMLEDRGFRASILDGNEKIEHIVSRSRKALKDALKDVQKGFDAANVLDTYLSGLSKTWQRDSPEHEAVYVAMLGNVEGWKRAFMDLHLEGNKVGGVLKKLMEIVEEMEKRAAAASRHQLAMSQASMATIQASSGDRSSAKPLPRAPTQRHSRRQSSQAINPLRESARPFSGGSNGRSSTGSTRTGQQTPEPGLLGRHAKQDSAEETDLSLRTPTITQTRADNAPVELPADVPEDALRQAPMSMKNRLSYTLGLKPKDNSDHRISSIYYPRALGDLLRTQQSPPILKTRQMSTVKQESPHSSTGDYFSAHIRGSSITLIPINSSTQQSAVTTPEKRTPSSAAQSPAIEKIESDARASVTSSPGLNSHPSVMAMSAGPPAPVELAAAGEHRRGQESKSSIGLLSSLGEPGPEVPSSEYDGSESKISDIPIFRIHEPDSAKRAKFVSGLDLPETVSHSLANTSTMERTSASVDEANEAQTADVPVSNEDHSKAQHVSSETKPDEADDNKTAIATESQIQSTECETPRQKDFVAELEAEVPRTPAAAMPTAREHGPSPQPSPNEPVEMEAPDAHFKLPSRASAIAIQVAPPPPQAKARNALLKARAEAASKESATVLEDAKKDPTTTQEALLKARAEAAEKDPATKPKDFSENARANQQPIQPLKLRLTKRDGKLVPVEVSDVPGVPSNRLSSDVIASMIDQMSDTPATSPLTERGPDKTSPRSGQKKFAPPPSAPSPPGPGGRPMVNPDYANAGAFDGERKGPSKATQRHSVGKVSSISAWKDMFSTAKTRRHSSDTSIKSTTRKSSMSGQAPGTQLLDTQTGVDVLWFKNGGRKSAPVDVS